ncbi:hypothetical protein BJX63DRAFT_432035 [Aspergillus granulosus]|uniref:Uncharacterized protein n=1 Tax=Aspergillus granulosus TaxID=176169 RepID=A0ABR4HDA9_9EURO
MAEDSQVGSVFQTPQYLSFILHPAHEPSPPDRAPIVPAEAFSNSRSKDALQKAQAALEMDEEETERLITAYFDSMVAINLFHQPSFPDKLAGIKCPTQAAALLAAMFTFAARFSQENESQVETNRRAEQFLILALRFINDALRDCGDRNPTLVRASGGHRDCALPVVPGSSWPRMAYARDRESVSDYDKLPYVAAVVKEAMRWRHVVPLAFPHAAAEDDWINGHLIPKNSTIITNGWGLHQDSTRFPHPDTFDPTHYAGIASLASASDPDLHDHYGYG